MTAEHLRPRGETQAKETIDHHPLKSLAIIPDGNRRWAVEQGMRPEEGMEAGAGAMLRVANFFFNDPEIETLYAWAFSTENWSRPQEQIDAVMQVTESTIKAALPLFEQHQISFKRLGRTERIEREYPSLWQTIQDAEERTKDFKNKKFGLLLDFGGDDQNLRIAQRLKTIILEDPNVEITEDLIASLRDGYEEGFRPADAVARTSGEHRTSGMGWIVEKAEFISIPSYLPEIGEEEGKYIKEEFKRRQIRNGR